MFYCTVIINNGNYFNENAPLLLAEISSDLSHAVFGFFGLNSFAFLLFFLVASRIRLRLICPISLFDYFDSVLRANLLKAEFDRKVDVVRSNSFLF